jgi:hypothetical protein
MGFEIGLGREDFVEAEMTRGLAALLQKIEEIIRFCADLFDER